MEPVAATPDSSALMRIAEEAFERRAAAGPALIREAPVVASVALAMARRFRGGGRLIVFGAGAASSDAQHVVVEFLHPVVVGKPALAAIGLTSDAATLTDIAARNGWSEVFAHQIRQLGTSADIALGILTEQDHAVVVRCGLEEARAGRLLTVSLHGVVVTELPIEADHRIRVAARDVLLAKEFSVALYHALWELVLVFLER